MRANAVRLLSLEEARAHKASVAIVGSGAGALAVAGELARHGIGVLMVEAGAASPGPAGRHRRNAFAAYDDFLAELVTKLRPHANANSRWPGLPGAAGVHAVGGMLGYWANMVPRPNLDVEWDGPVDAVRLQASLAKAEMLFDATDRLYGEGSERQQWIRAQLARHFGSDIARPAELAGRRLADGAIEWSAGDSLLGGCEDNVAILPEAVVTRLVCAGGKIKALELVDLRTRATASIEADFFVVGGGVIGTPQLLFASGMRDSAALGGYLTDHINLVTRVILKDQSLPEAKNDPPVFLRIAPSPERDFQVGILDIPSKAHVGQLAFSEGLRTTDIGLFVGSDPAENNRLRFDAETLDGFGLPSVSADIEPTTGDTARMKQAFAMQYELAAAIGEPWRGMTPLLQPFGASLHMMGTYRMGADPKTSVADQDSKMWGYDNVYLAGNGLLGAKNHCNPTLTTVALGLLAAEAMAGKAPRR